MDANHQAFLAELIEEALDVAADYGYAIGSKASPAHIAHIEQFLATAADKLYTGVGLGPSMLGVWSL
jgi:hypothetical protein